MKGSLVYRCFQWQQKIWCGICSLLMRAAGWLWGVEFRGPVQFYGLARFVRHPQGYISVGRDVVLRSDPAANTIGLNRRCFLSAAAGARLEIGDGCGLSGTVIAAAQEVRLGQRVMCGANVTITDSDRHPLNAQARQRGEPGASAPVWIGDDVWLGLNVVVLKGVHIGAGSVIAANSLVINDIPPGSLAAGQPAVVLRSV